AALECFPLVKMQQVLQRERLEKKFVARVVVGGNRLRVRVDHERLEAVFLERKRGVHATVIELDALADPVRTAAENHYLALVRRPHFVVAAVVSRIVVGCVSLKFGGTGVHETIARNESEFFPQRADFVLGFAGKICDLPVGKSERFGFGQQFRIEFGHQVKIKPGKSKPGHLGAGKFCLESFVWKAYLIFMRRPNRLLGLSLAVLAAILIGIFAASIQRTSQVLTLSDGSKLKMTTWAQGRQL